MKWVLFALPIVWTTSAMGQALPVSQGGTGATTAAGARINLGTAASGANSDINSLSGQPSPLLINGALSVQSGSSPAIIDFHTSPPPNFVAINGAGSYIDQCNPTGCLQGPHLLASSVFASTTHADQSAQEINAELNSIMNTGKAVSWRPSTNYNSGDAVINHNTGGFGSVYRAAASCTSGTGAGPSGTSPNPQVDGSCSWTYYTNALNAGKSNLSVSTVVQPGSANAWGVVTDIVAQAGIGNINVYGEEHDCNNDNIDSTPGNAYGFSCVFMGGQSDSGSQPMLAYWLISSNNQTYGAHYGQLYNNNNAIKDSVIADGTTATSTIIALEGRAHAGAFLEDDSNSSNVLNLGPAGHHTVGLNLTGGNFSSGDFMQVPATTFLKWNGNSNAMGYNGSIGALTYGTTNSGSAYGLASYNNGDLGVGNHLFVRSNSKPTLSNCGTSASLSNGANDTHGTITEGSSATGCTLTFATSRNSTPDCIVTAWNNFGDPVQLFHATQVAFSFSNASSSGQMYSYICMGQ